MLERVPLFMVSQISTQVIRNKGNRSHNLLFMQLHHMLLRVLKLRNLPDMSNPMWGPGIQTLIKNLEQTQPPIHSPLLKTGYVTPSLNKCSITHPPFPNPKSFVEIKAQNSSSIKQHQAQHNAIHIPGPNLEAQHTALSPHGLSHRKHNFLVKPHLWILTPTPESEEFHSWTLIRYKRNILRETTWTMM